MPENKVLQESNKYQGKDEPIQSGINQPRDSHKQSEIHQQDGCHKQSEIHRKKDVPVSKLITGVRLEMLNSDKRGPRCAVFLNGCFKPSERIKNTFKENGYDIIICADGGTDHAYEMGLIPDYIIGDLDSANLEIVEYMASRGAEISKCKAEKDETDAELCVLKAIDLGVDRLDFYSALGGRIDHEISNVGLLSYCRKRGIEARIVDESQIITLIENEGVIIREPLGTTVSAISIKGDSYGVSYRGFHYILKDYTFEYAAPIGISNVVTEDEAEISVREGSLLIVVNY